MNRAGFAPPGHLAPLRFDVGAAERENGQSVWVAKEAKSGSRKKPGPPADTDLVRLVWINFAGEAPKHHFIMRWDNVTVESFGRKDSSVLVAGSTSLRYLPTIDGDNLVVVPRKERHAVEEVLDTIANLLAVAHHCGATISASGFRSVFFSPATERARDWLESARGIREQSRASSLNTWARIDLAGLSVTDLGSRKDGLALLAEALASSHATGAFHEYVRLFERAFRRPASRITDLVLATLDPALEYDRSEVAVWFDKVRDPATHADERPTVVMAADVAPLLPRISQAAYDILFNKRDWRSDTTVRRNFCNPRAGIKKGNELFAVQGEAPVTTMTWLDEVGVYPLNFGPDIPSSPRSEWWPTDGAGADARDED